MDKWNSRTLVLDRGIRPIFIKNFPFLKFRFLKWFGMECGNYYYKNRRVPAVFFPDTNCIPARFSALKPPVWNREKVFPIRRTGHMVLPGNSKSIAQCPESEGYSGKKYILPSVGSNPKFGK